jgi:hypothetical protein
MWRWIAVAVTALMLAGCKYEDDGNLPKGWVEVPSVDGMDVETAERALAGAGMKISPGQTYASDDGVHFTANSRRAARVTRQLPVGAAPPGTPVALATTDVGMDFVQLRWDATGYADRRLTLHLVGQMYHPESCPVVDHVRVGPPRGDVRRVEIWGSYADHACKHDGRIVIDVGRSWAADTVIKP